MGRAERVSPIRQATRALHWLALAAAIPTVASQAQTTTPGPPDSAESTRIERLERMMSTVVEENRRLAEEVRTLKGQLAARPPQPPSPALPEAIPADKTPGVEALRPSPGFAPPASGVELDPSPAWQALPWTTASRYRVDYENGFAILPENFDETPFSLRIRSQNVFRYDGFSRDATYWTDSAGTRKVIANNNFFGIPRGRIIFTGRVLLPKLSYTLNIDYNSVTSNPIGFRAYELVYRFSRAFELGAGQTKVPASREWQESAFAPLQGPDRSMATTFFRPSLSQGMWIFGEPLDGWHYRAMVSNGFNTLNLLPNQLNNRMCYTVTTLWEPWGAFGAGYSDLQDHREAAIRLGGSYAYAIGRGDQADSDAVENSPLRLSDGTIITTPGALAPGVTLNAYDVSLGTIDFAFKRRGLGLSTELYSQELLKFRGTGALPIHSTRAYGGVLQGGYFVIPQRGELYARTSAVTGAFGSGWELGGGLNWFCLQGRDNLRYTIDATWLEHSPAGQNRTGYNAGQTGLLFRTQMTVVY